MVSLQLQILYLISHSHLQMSKNPHEFFKIPTLTKVSYSKNFSLENGCLLRKF